MPLNGPHEAYINKVKADSICRPGERGESPPSEKKPSQTMIDIEKHRIMTLDREGRVL